MTVPQPDRPDFVDKRVLIVDDFDGMRNILRDLLRKVGARQIDVAANGNEALTALTRNKYDVVLCDYYLGAGKSGQQVLEEARAKSLIGASTVFCIISAEKTSDMVMGAVEHQPDDYLIKPLTEAMLQTRLAKLVKRKTIMATIQAALRAKEYLKAIALCEKQLAEDRGGSGDLVRLRCELLILTGNYEAARTAYEKQLAVRDTAWAKAGLAKLHFQEGEYHHARSLLQQLVEDNRAYLEGYDWLAKTLIQLGEWQEAETVLIRATTLSPLSAPRQQSLGEAAWQCNDLEVAEQAFRKSISLSAHSALKTPQPYLGLANVCSRKGNSKEALEILGRLTKEVEGEMVKIQAKAAEVRVHRAADDNTQAQRCAEELSVQVQKGTHDMPPAATLDLAEALMQLDNKEVASKLIQFVARNHHEDEALLKRARDIFERAEMGEAGNQALESSRRLAIDYMDKGVRLARQGKLGDGIEVMREACGQMPNNARVLLNHAYLLISHMEKQGWHHAMFNEARRCIETARKHTLDDKRCGLLLAKLETIK